MFNPHLKLSSSGRHVVAFVSFTVVLAVWSALSGFDVIASSKLPSPWAVVKALGYLAWYDGNSMLLEATYASTVRIVMAAVLVLLIGIPIGVLMGASPLINAAVSPLVDPFRSAPIVALLPVLVMWLGIGETMKVAFLFIGAVVYLIPLVRDAMVSVQYAYWESLRDMGATHMEAIMRGVLPLAAPRIFDAVIVSTSILWTYITVAEYVNADAGLGQLIQNARRFSAMDQVFAGIFVIIVLALLTNWTLTQVRQRLYSWEGK